MQRIQPDVRRLPTLAGATLLLLLTVAFTATGFAGGASVRAMGMGGAYTALARGLDAPAWNPANLALAENPGLSVGLFSGAATVSNNGIDLDLYNRTTGQVLSLEDQHAILAAIPAEGLATTADAAASVLGVQWRSLALTFSGQAAAHSNLPHDAFELLLMGNATADSIVFDEADGEAYALASVALSTGVTLLQREDMAVHVGMSLRYFEALAYGRLHEASGSIVTAMTGIRGEGLATLDTAGRGQGAGVDLGVAMDLGEMWHGGLSLQNAFAQLHFSDDLQRRVYTVRVDTLTVESLEDTEDLVSNEQTESDLDPFDVSLPRILHLGLGRVGPRSAVALEWEQGFSTRAGSTSTPRIAVGGEYRPLHWMPLRLGLSLGGANGPSASAGLGFAVGGFRMDFAAATHGNIIPGDPRGVSLAVGTGLSF